MTTRPHSRELDLLTAVLLAAAVFGTLYPDAFVSAGNARAVLKNLAFDGILAVGMMLLMVAGVFDLSVGAMASLAGVLCGWLMFTHPPWEVVVLGRRLLYLDVWTGWPPALAVVATLLVAAACGRANGLLVTRARINALIATLGTLGIFSGATILIGGPGITGLPDGFTRLGQTELLGIQLPVWVMLALAAVGHYLLQHTAPFRRYYYVGANPKAARLSGIDVAGLQVLGFTLMGLIAGLAGLLFAARVGTAVSTAGVGAELRVITAVILGGASLTGGKGTIPGALIGVVFMALVNNLLILGRVSSYWTGIVVGVILVLAVALDAVQTRRRS